jgi:hypothetical protein
MARGACAAVRTLELNLKTEIPFLAGSYKEGNGKMLPRLQIPGNPRHQLGVCLDIILFAAPSRKGIDWEAEKKLGENLVKLFIEQKDLMKWTEIIFQDRFFWEPEYYKAYNKDRLHFTHIHIDWMTNSLKGKGKSENEILDNSPQKDANGFSATLSARLAQINQQWKTGGLTNIDLASIGKTYSPDKNPVGDWKVSVGQWLWIYTFDSAGNVKWRDPYNNQSGKGTWTINSGVISFKWTNSTTTESWNLPIEPTGQKGTTTMKGTRYAVNAVRL